MQVKITTERELVELCMKELCRKSGFADCRNLVQRDYEFICDNIEATTGVLISLSTIKRLFNGQFSRLPQAATLNAISLYLGYLHWQDFKSNHLAANGAAIKDQMEANDTVKEMPAPARHPTAYKRWLWLIGFLALTGAGLFIMLQQGEAKPANFEKAQFSMSRTTGNDLPNTVVFNYNIEDVNADSFFIQQSWDKYRRVRIEKNSHTLTDIYYEPGYHIAKLIANDKVIRTIDVSIPTDRWFFYAKEKKPGSLPQYINPSTPFSDGLLKMQKEDIEEAGIEIKKEHNYIQVFFPSKFESSSDSFILKTRVRVNDIAGSFCPSLMCEIFCQKNFMYFISTPKGCTSEINAQFGENVLNGKTNDLSALGSNVKEWQDIEFRVINKKASIRINDKEVFTGSYQQSSGLITGLGFISNGLPEVDFVSLQTAGGKDIYTNDFNAAGK